MAQAFSNPIPAPDFMEPDGRFDRDGYFARVSAYEAETEKYVRSLGYKHKHTGKIISFPVGDGAARYMLCTPTKWVHLADGDAWNANPATIRGTRAVDVDAMIDRNRRMAELFGGR